MAGLGGSLGYVMGALDWGSLGEHDHHDHHSFMIVNLMIFMIVIIMGSLDWADTVLIVIIHTSIVLV